MKKKIIHLALMAAIASTTANAQTGNFGIGTATPGSKLTVNGSFAATYNNVTTANYTMLTSDYYLAYNGTGGTATLPAALAIGSGNYQGRVYNIKNTGSGTLTIAANGSELLDNQSGAGVATISLAAGYYVMLISKGTTTGTTWEVAIVGNSSTCTPVAKSDNTVLGNYVANSATATMLANSTQTVITTAAGLAIVSYSLGYDLTESVTGAPATLAYGDLAGDYVSFEIYLNGAATGVKLVQQMIPTTGGNCTVTGSVNLVAGTNTLTLRGTRTIDVKTNVDHSFSMLSSSFSTYFNPCGGSAGGSNSGTVTANNGLTASGSNVQLGGTLIKNTDVALAGFNQTFSGTGNLGIGTTAPTQVLDIVTQNTGNDNLHLTSYNTTPSPAIRFRAASGTTASPSFVPIATTAFGSMNSAVWNGSTFSDVTAIRSFATETHSATALGSNMTFSTTANGTTAITERMRIDQNGQVGIGTTTPHSVLDLGTIVTGKKLALYDNAAGTDFYGFGLSNNLLQFHVGAATAAADMTLNSLGDLTITGASATKTGGSNTWTVTSDVRAKKNVQDYQAGLEAVMAIRPVTFQYNGKYGQTDTRTTYVGIVAQEMEKILPGTIYTQERDGLKDFKTYNASELTYTLVNAIKEQQAEIEALKAANTKLVSDNASLKSSLDSKAPANILDEMQAALQALRTELQNLKAAGSTVSGK